jgi:hypothetical protein
MGKLGRKIERGILKKRGKDLQGGVDMVRRFLGSDGEGVQSVSEAIMLLKQIGPVIEECRNAAYLAVQHAIAIERELEREKHVRRALVQSVREGSFKPLSQVEEEAAAAWEKANPPPKADAEDGKDAAAGAA